MSLSLAALFEALSGEFDARLLGDSQICIDRLAPVESAGPSELAFVSHPKHLNKLAASKAACIIASPALEAAAVARGACIITPDPYRYFARVSQVWRQHHAPAQAVGIHPSAFIDPTAQLGEGVSVGAFVCVEAGAVVGAGTVLGAHVVIGRGAMVGAACRLAPRVTLGDDCRLGQRCILHAGVVIGSDGFGFAPADGRWEKIEQLGAVRIGDDVEIGANTCIDRGALQDTVIEDGVKLDNLIQIGHNVHIGRHSALAGCVGVAGSARIGEHCTIGGGAVVLGHLSLADHVHISAASVVTRSISKPGLHSGFFPIDDNTAWEKNAASLKQLHSLRLRLKHLEKQLQSAVPADLPHQKNDSTP